MIIDAFWFNCMQSGAEVLQPEFFTPRTQLRVYAELQGIAFPFTVNVSALIKKKVVFNKSYLVEDTESAKEFKLEVFSDGGAIILSDYADALKDNPDCIDVEIRMGETVYSQSVRCEYVTVSGRTTDFDGKPFPAAVIYNLHTFEGLEGGIGAWSGADGSYSLTLPKAEYHSIFVDDNTYAKTSLEAWGWKMIADRDEVHDYKIGNGEVYSLDVWTNNGGFANLFVYFRPMVLSYAMKQNIVDAEAGGKSYKMLDTCPDISADDVSVELNNRKLTVISVQKIIETGQDGSGMPAYILQVERPRTLGKQTLVAEYNFKDANGEPVQAQGRTQFNYTNVCGLALR